MGKLLHKTKERNTIRAQKLVGLISDNLGNPEGGRTMYEMMVEAGYSESTARQQTNILAGIRPKLRPLVAQLESAREAALALLPLKITKASYRDLVTAIDRFNASIALFDGEPTSRIAARIEPQTDVDEEQFGRILDLVIKRRDERKTEKGL